MQIKIIDNVFSEKELEILDNLCNGELKRLDSSGNHVNYYTEYEWNLVKSPIRESQHRHFLLKKIGEQLGINLPSEELEPLQLFVKQFDENSFLDKHSEDPNLYGPYVWMLYLTDEIDGELCTDTVKIMPKRNRLVIMETGFDHWVEKCSGKRLNISGWPFITDKVRQKWKEKDSTKIS